MSLTAPKQNDLVDILKNRIPDVLGMGYYCSGQAILPDDNKELEFAGWGPTFTVVVEHDGEHIERND